MSRQHAADVTAPFAVIISQAMKLEAQARAAGCEALAQRHGMVKLEMLAAAQRFRARWWIIQNGYGELLLDDVPAMCGDDEAA